MIFSVVIPTYNRKHLLKKCLSSFFAQTFPEDQYEVIVVDDGSTDGTANSLTLLNPLIPFFFLTQEHKGPAAARNLGIKHTQGEIIAFTDDDCVPPRDWLEKLYDGFKRHPEVAVVSGYQEAPEEILQKNLIAQYERFQTRELYGGKDRGIVGGFETPGGVTNNMAVKRQVFDKVGLFDENFPVPGGEDADLKKRIADSGFKFLYIPLKVEHHQEYSLRGFLHQQKTRGIGGRYFREKWEQGSIDWLLPLKSIPRFFITWWKSRSLRMAGLEFLGRIWMFFGGSRTRNYKPMKLKILMVSDLFPPVDGGVPTVVYELSKRLAQRGHKVAVATYQFQKDWPDYEIVGGIEVFRAPLKWNKFIPFYFSAPLNMKSLVTSVWKELGGFDVLHLHLSLAGIGALMVPQAKSLPKIFTFYGDWAKEYLAEASGWKKKIGISKIEAKVMRFMQRRCLRSSDAIICLSQYSKGGVRSLVPEVSVNKIQIIPGGVDLEKFQLQSPKRPNQLKSLEDRFFILTIRRLYKRMGLENLISAIDIVRKEFPEVFLIIGGRGYLEESLKFKIQSSKLEDNVRLEGFIPEEQKPEYLATADLYVLPTVSLEGFGLTILESLACGTPVLGTPTGATPELLGAFRKDFILQGTLAKDIAEGIIGFIKKYRGDETLRLSCREYAEKFSWEKMVEEYEGLYRELVREQQNF